MKVKPIQERIEEVDLVQLADEQEDWAKFGVDTAIADGEVVTIGGPDCDCFDWKEFMIDRIVNLGSEEFCDLFDWSHDDLIDALLTYEDSDWKDFAVDNFEGMEA